MYPQNKKVRHMLYLYDVANKKYNSERARRDKYNKFYTWLKTFSTFYDIKLSPFL